MIHEQKSFDKLVEEKADCFEFAWNGFIRLYEDGERKCECKSCKYLESEKLNKCDH